MPERPSSGYPRSRAKIRALGLRGAAPLLAICLSACSDDAGHATCTDEPSAQAYAKAFVADLVTAGESGKHPFKLTDQTQIDLLGVEAEARRPADVCNWIDEQRAKLGL